MHRQCYRPLCGRLPERERWRIQHRQDFHLSVNNNPGKRTRLPHSACFTVYQPSGHVPWLVISVIACWAVFSRPFTSVIVFKDKSLDNWLRSELLILESYTTRKKCHELYIHTTFLCLLWTGVTVETSLDGIRAQPEYYPQTSKKVPDVNFYYRYHC